MDKELEVQFKDESNNEKTNENHIYLIEITFDSTQYFIRHSSSFVYFDFKDGSESNLLRILLYSMTVGPVLKKFLFKINSL